MPGSTATFFPRNVEAMPTSDPRIVLQLRFLAEAAISALAAPASGADPRQDSLPENAAEPILRALLEHSVPVLRAAGHDHLADQIEAVLRAGETSGAGQQ